MIKCIHHFWHLDTYFVAFFLRLSCECSCILGPCFFVTKPWDTELWDTAAVIGLNLKMMYKLHRLRTEPPHAFI